VSRHAGVVLGVVVVALGGVLLLALQGSRRARQVADAWSALERRGAGGVFDPESVAGLPEPVQRYFMHAVAPGTVLASHAVLRMRGEIVLREGSAPLAMEADQILSPPHGFIWRARIGRGLLRMSGFDRYSSGTGEMRWSVWGLVPVVRATGADVTRSAAGRLAGEGLLVAPTMLPARGVVWQAVDEHTARAVVDVDGEAVSILLSVDATGRMQRVVIERWNGDPANGPIGYLPFVVQFEGDVSFDGYRLPRRLRAGWERDGAFRPFFFAELEDATFR
jgi:hypothetical protein